MRSLVRRVVGLLLAVGLFAPVLAGCAKDEDNRKTATARPGPTHSRTQDEVERVLARFGTEAGRLELDAAGGRTWPPLTTG